MRDMSLRSVACGLCVGTPGRRERDRAIYLHTSGINQPFTVSGSASERTGLQTLGPRLKCEKQENRYLK